MDAWIAFDSDRDGSHRHIFAVRPDGCDVRQLTAGAFDDYQPSWSPDGASIVFVSNRDGGEALYVLDLVTSTTVPVVGASCTMPSWSLDGSKIVCASGATIFLLSSVPPNAKQSISVGGPVARWPVLEHDGSAVVYDEQNEIDARSLTSSVTKAIVPSQPNTQEMPAISNDGQKLAFSIYCEPGVETILVTTLAGVSGVPCQKASRFTPVGEYAKRPAWGPSDIMAFERGKGLSTLAVSVSGGPVFGLVTANDNKNPSWSPVGATLP